MAVKARCLSLEILRGRWLWCNGAGTGAVGSGAGAALRLPLLIICPSWLHAACPCPVRRRPHWTHRGRPLSVPLGLFSALVVAEDDVVAVAVPPMSTSPLAALLEALVDTDTAAPLAEPVILFR